MECKWGLGRGRRAGRRQVMTKWVRTLLVACLALWGCDLSGLYGDIDVVAGADAASPSGETHGGGGAADDFPPVADAAGGGGGSSECIQGVLDVMWYANALCPDALECDCTTFTFAALADGRYFSEVVNGGGSCCCSVMCTEGHWEAACSSATTGELRLTTCDGEVTVRQLNVAGGAMFLGEREYRTDQQDALPLIMDDKGGYCSSFGAAECAF